MNDQTENNKLIAEFMGYEVLKDTTEVYAKAEGSDCFILSASKYHTSWNWLMPVVAKIRDLAPNLKHLEGFDDTGIIMYLMRCNLDNTYNAVVDSINWYNENQGGE